MTFRILLLLLMMNVILTITCFAGHRDYSKRGAEYSVLNGIRLKVNKISFFEKRLVSVEGFDLSASVFKVRSNVTIQTRESVVSEGSAWEDLDVEYELIVGNDNSNHLHDKLIEDIHRFWLTHPLDNSVTGDKNVTLNDGTYLIFTGRWPPPDAVWFDGRFVIVKFSRFLDKNKGGFGAEQSFWEGKIRFYDGKKRVKLEFLVNGRQAEFLRLYDSGRFKRETK